MICTKLGIQDLEKKQKSFVKQTVQKSGKERKNGDLGCCTRLRDRLMCRSHICACYAFAASAPRRLGIGDSRPPCLSLQLSSRRYRIALLVHSLVVLVVRARSVANELHASNHLANSEESKDLGCHNSSSNELRSANVAHGLEGV